MRLSTFPRPALLVATLAAAILIGPSLVAGAAGNGNTTTTTSGTNLAARANVRVFHAVPGGPAVDVFIDGHKFISNLTYMDIAPYVALPTGKHNIQVLACNAGAAKNGCMTTNTITNKCVNTASNGCILSATVTLTSTSYSTLAIVGSLSSTSGGASKLQAKLLAGPSTTANGAGSGAGASGTNNSQAMIDVANLSPDAPAVNVAANSSGTLFRNISFANTSSYTNLSSGTYTFVAYPATGSASSSKQSLVTVLPNAAVTPGHTYSLFILGMANTAGAKGAALPKLSAVLVDTTPAAIIVLPMATQR